MALTHLSPEPQSDDRRDQRSPDSDLSDQTIAAAVARLRLRVAASNSGQSRPLRPRDLAE